MSRFRSRNYRLPRWPLVKNTMACAFWMLLGIGLLFAPIGLGRWIGVLPMGYGLARWSFCIRPRWKHVISMDDKQLVIGTRSYDWDRFDQMRLERSGANRTIRLLGQAGKLDIAIKDDLPGFDDLSQDCFSHMNRGDGDSGHQPSPSKPHHQRGTQGTEELDSLLHDLQTLRKQP